MGDANSMMVGTSGGGSDATGLVWLAPIGTTAPTDATTALNAGFKDAGYIAESGVVMSFAETAKDIKVYGSQIPVRTIVTDQKFTAKWTMAEINEISMAVFWRKDLNAITPAVSTGAFSVTGTSYSQKLFSAVFEVIDATRHVRLYYPSMEISQRDDINISNGNEIGWGVTATGYPVAGVAVTMFAAIPSLG